MDSSNFLVGLLGGATTWVGVMLVVLLCVWTALYCKKHWQSKNKLSFFSGVAIRCMLIILTAYMSSVVNSNAPKHQLQPNYNYETTTPLDDEGRNLPPLENNAPNNMSAEERSKKLDRLREEQKESSSLN